MVQKSKNDNTNILNVRGLKKYFPIQKGFLRKVVGYTKAVDGVDFFIKNTCIVKGFLGKMWG